MFATDTMRAPLTTLLGFGACSLGLGLLGGCASPAVPARDPAPVAAVASDCGWRREADGFQAAVLVTADAGWKRTCSLPTAKLPAVPQTGSLYVGGKVWALLFVSNPLPDETGAVDVTCDLRMVRPNGRISEHHNLKALHKNLGESAPLTFLSEFVLTMVGEENDPLGEWVIELTVHDRNRGVDVPVKCHYTLLPREQGYAMSPVRPAGR